MHTPIGNIGVALCWEMIRTDTLNRLMGKANLILAGSCWWDLPMDASAEREPLCKYNQSLALETPCTFAKLLYNSKLSSAEALISGLGFDEETE